MINIPRHKKDLIEAVKLELSKQIFKTEFSLDCKLALTDKMLSPAEASKLEFKTIENPSAWGSYGQYGWFSAKLPFEVTQPMVAMPLFGGECIGFQNGYALGSVDKKHSFVLLKPSQGLELLFEAFAGGDSGFEHGTFGLKTAPSYQRPVFQGLKICSLDKDLYDAFISFSMIYSLMEVIEPTSLLALKCRDALFDFSIHVDFENFNHNLVSLYLLPVLSAHNGTLAPTLYMFGQSHLDLAWLWSFGETKRKVARTYANTLALMDAYEHYKFLACETIILDMLEELHPEIYKRVQEKIAQGRFFCEGGFYVESDTNFPSGESLIRQLVRGQMGFVYHSGKTSSFAWLPDCFGFSAVLPQLFKLAGIKYFSTNKLQRQDPEAQSFPFNDFWWEGTDGSLVRANNCFKNNCINEPKALWQRWNENRLQNDNIDSLMFPFGHGDGGGGPTLDMVEMQAREADIQGLPRVRFEGPVQFFEDLKPTTNHFFGELYLAWHRGTYTSQRKLKSLMRRCENALRDAELSLALKGQAPHFEKEEKVILFNQFHDIISGVSIAPVNIEAEKQLASCYESLSKFALPKKAEDDFVPFTQKNGTFVASNGIVSVTLSKGQITEFSFNGRNIVSPNGAFGVLRMYEDFNPSYDAWEIARHYRSRPVSLPLAQPEGLSEDKKCLTLKAKLNEKSNARIELKFSRTTGLCFDITVDWHEREKLLRLEFDHNLIGPLCLASNQFGYVRRPCDMNYQASQDKFEAPSQGYAVLSEGESLFLGLMGKEPFGYSSQQGTLGVSLLKSASAPDYRAEEGEHHLSFALNASDSLGALQACSSSFNGQISFELACQSLFVLNNHSIRVSSVKITEPSSLLIRLYNESGTATTTSIQPSFDYSKVQEVNFLSEFVGSISVEECHFHPFEVKTLIFNF